MTSTTITIQVENTKNDAMACATVARKAMEENRKQKISSRIDELSKFIKKYSESGICRFSYKFKDEDSDTIIKEVILYFRSWGFSVVKTITDGKTIIIDWEYAE